MTAWRHDSKNLKSSVRTACARGTREEFWKYAVIAVMPSWDINSMGWRVTGWRWNSKILRVPHTRTVRVRSFENLPSPVTPSPCICCTVFITVFFHKSSGFCGMEFRLLPFATLFYRITHQIDNWQFLNLKVSSVALQWELRIELRQLGKRTRMDRILRICAKHGCGADINTEAGACRGKARAILKHYKSRKNRKCEMWNVGREIFKHRKIRKKRI